MKSISIATWNINSIRARMDSLATWLQEAAPDIVLLQETKCSNRDFPEETISSMGYNSIYIGQKSYNGVAILSKYPIDIDKRRLLPNDEQARYIEGLVTICGKLLRVVSIYVPQGGGDLAPREQLEDSKKFKYKLEFFDALHRRINDITNFEELVILGGDLNVAHHDIDLHAPEKYRGQVGFHRSERLEIQRIIDAGYTDLFRKFNPDTAEYTWWDYRRGGWQGNRGWRIDYMMANNKTVEMVEKCTIHRSVRGHDKPSDHVPVEAILLLH